MTYWVWLGLVLFFVIAELCSTQLVSIWMAFGALLTCIITAIFGNIPVIWQLFMFAAFSAVALIATRPLCKRFLQKKMDHRTNLDRLIGEDAIVIESINNLSGSGVIKLHGQEWSAKSLNGDEIASGEVVIFKEIQGNKALVIKKEK